MNLSQIFANFKGRFVCPTSILIIFKILSTSLSCKIQLLRHVKRCQERFIHYNSTKNVMVVQSTTNSPSTYFCKAIIGNISKQRSTKKFENNKIL